MYRTEEDTKNMLKEQRTFGAEGNPAQSPNSASLARAARLARDGRFEEANHVILEVLRMNPDLRPSCLHLSGKILAQQKRYREAEAHWQEALRLDPGNPEYRKALQAIEDERSLWPRLRRPVLGLLILGLLFLILGERSSRKSMRENLSAFQDLLGKTRMESLETHAALDAFAKETREHETVLAGKIENLQNKLERFPGLLVEQSRGTTARFEQLGLALSEVEERMQRSQDTLKADLRASLERNSEDIRELFNRGQDMDAGLSREVGEVHGDLERVSATLSEILESLTRLREEANRTAFSVEIHEQTLADFGHALVEASQSSREGLSNLSLRIQALQQDLAHVAGDLENIKSLLPAEGASGVIQSATPDLFIPEVEQ